MTNSDIKKKIQNKISEIFCKANSTVSYKVIDYTHTHIHTPPHTHIFFHMTFF